MYLSSKQLLWLLFPLVFSFFIYFFSVEIIESTRSFFPTYKKYSNMDLNTKIDNYAEIETKYVLFKDVQKKVELRQEEAKWVADNLFYRVFDGVKTEQNEKLVSVKAPLYKLEALFPDDKTAIIDGLIVKEGSLVHSARVIKIQSTKVQIKTNKGLKWLFLFN